MESTVHYGRRGRPARPNPTGRPRLWLALGLAALLLWLMPLSALAAPANGPGARPALNTLQPGSVTTLDGAGPDRDLAGVNPRDYMMVTLTTTRAPLAFRRPAAPAWCVASCG
jgi:hypothetical protein